MRIWILNNTRFGYKNNSKEWSKTQFDYFYNFYIPFLQKNKKEGDIIIHLGNFFNNSESINTSILNLSLDLISTITKIIPMYLMVGENDRPTQDNIINTLNIFKHQKDIKIFTHTTIIEENNKKIKLIPNSKQVFKDLYDDYDYVFLNNNILNHFDLLKIKNKAYCGYYDDKKIVDDYIFVGAPYQLDKTSEDKGFYVLDITTGKDTFIANKISPKFITIKIDDITQIGNIDENIVNNNFVKVLVDKKLLETNEVKTNFLLSKLNFKKIEYVDTNKIEDEYIEDENALSIEELLRTKIQAYDNELLSTEFEKIIQLYKEKYK